MNKIIKAITIFLFFLAPFPLYSQIKGKGLPFIVNHPNSTYNAGTQNWGITQCENGFLYFANNDVILSVKMASTANVGGQNRYSEAR